MFHALLIPLAFASTQQTLVQTFVTPSKEFLQQSEPLQQNDLLQQNDVVELQCRHVHAAALDADAALGSAALTSPAGVAWTWDDGGQGWIGTAVALGFRGTHVFTETNKNAMAAHVLSVFDVDPPTPVWSAPAPTTDARKVVSAELTDLHVVIHEQLLASGRRAEVIARNSISPQPLWSYVFAPTITTGCDVAVARDGSVVVAAISRDDLGQVDVAVLDPEHGTQLSYTSIAVGGPLRGFELSGDGALLVFTANSEAYVFSVAQHQVVFSADVGTSLDSVGISGDGSVLAFGGYNWMRVLEQAGALWSPTYTRFVPGANYVSALDVSDDGSTVAYGFTYYDTFLSVRVEALDVIDKVVTMSDVALGIGPWQALVSDIAVSADGERFAVGTWGDAGGLIGELRYYSSTSDTPLVSFDLAGSVFDVDISADGRRVAAAGKAMHANVLGLGGAITFYDTHESDLTLQGAPRIGTTPVFEIHGAPGKLAWLLRAELAADPPFRTSSGMLYLDRFRIEAKPCGPIGPAGIALLPFQLSSAPGLVGATLHFQGLTSPPASLTRDWLSLTILP